MSAGLNFLVENQPGMSGYAFTRQLMSFVTVLEALNYNTALEALNKMAADYVNKATAADANRHLLNPDPSIPSPQ